MSRDVAVHHSQGQALKAQTLGQEKYLEAIRKNTTRHGRGPAGTQDLSCGCGGGCAFRDQARSSRIILTRPAVEAGEKLCFLPAPCKNGKGDPYSAPAVDDACV